MISSLVPCFSNTSYALRRSAGSSLEVAKPSPNFSRIVNQNRRVVQACSSSTLTTGRAPQVGAAPRDDAAELIAGRALAGVTGGGIANPSLINAFASETEDHIQRLEHGSMVRVLDVDGTQDLIALTCHGQLFTALVGHGLPGPRQHIFGLNVPVVLVAIIDTPHRWNRHHRDRRAQRWASSARAQALRRQQGRLVFPSSHSSSCLLVLVFAAPAVASGAAHRALRILARVGRGLVLDYRTQSVVTGLGFGKLDLKRRLKVRPGAH